MNLVACERPSRETGTAFPFLRRVGAHIFTFEVPLLANLYMSRLLKGWRNTKRGEQYDARIVNDADDFVILSRGKAAEALNWTRQVVDRMGSP